MERALTGFVRALRAAGAEASPGETIDAARALSLIGYADRELMKAALATSLAKSEAELLIYERVFEQYFAAPAEAAATSSQAGSAAPTAAGDAAAPTAAGDAAAPARTGQADVDALLALAAGGDTQRGGQAGNSALRLALSRAAQQVGVDDIRFQSQTSYFSRRMLEVLGIAGLEALLLRRLGQAEQVQRQGQLESATELAHLQAEIDALQAARTELQRQAAAHVQQRYAIFGQPATEAFMTDVVVTRRFNQQGRLAPADMQRMSTAVQHMAKRLAVKHSRRLRIRQHGQLDMRRTLRANAGHDGVPFHLRFQYKRRDKPRIVVLCDVSGSVAPTVRFLLLFLYALQGLVSDLRSFAFSNHLRDVGAPLEGLPFEAAMQQIIDEVGGGSTDYGQALVDLHQRHWSCIDRRTTVLILGDGRSNYANPQLHVFAELAQRAKRVVWLCTEPPGRWGSGDSCMLQYRPLCSHVSYCANALDLERVIDEALEAYD